MSEKGGPIESLKFYSVKHNEFKFEANAILKKELVPESFQQQQNILYGNGHGSGSASSRIMAQYTAISEALERWAFMQTVFSTQAGALGFDLEPSTTGMAAFPALTTYPARVRALGEAIERYSVAAWWEGLLAAKVYPLKTLGPAIEGIELQPIYAGFHTLVFAKKLKNDLYAYGFASGKNYHSVELRAKIELSRNERVLDKLDTMDLSLLQTQTEKRLAYFSTVDGYQSWKSRVDLSCSGSETTVSKPPHLKIDREIRGPWSQYTRVWRCLFDSSALTRYALSANELNYFLF
jgi:hypothetical protein